MPAISDFNDADRWVVETALKAGKDATTNGLDFNGR